MNITEITDKLRQPFPVGDHEIRKVPGGGQPWVYIRWQKIRSRLNQVCPEWQVTYSDPQYLEEYCYIRCTLTIGGVSREALGTAKIELLSSQGKDMARGNPIQRAVADAFKNAAEAFGVGAYLDNQAYTKNYLKQQGDNRLNHNGDRL